MAPNQKQEMGDQTEIEPYLMTILSKKFEAITRNMTQSLLRSARSGVINVARDFSSGITTGDGRLFMMDEGLPVHLANIQFVPRYTLKLFDDISSGDCFLTNSPYFGNSHAADFTLHAPVFYDGELLFWSINKAHQADIGAPEPTTYLHDAETVYEEGPHLPSVRFQENYKDKEDLVRFMKINIRLGEEQWYYDYKAQIEAVRQGEESIEELIGDYGLGTTKKFVEEWLDYGEQMMRKEIKKLPEKRLEYTAHHDSLPGAPDGVPVKMIMSTNPESGDITVDLTDNMDSLPCGFNLCEATTVAAVYTGIFNNLDPNVPHNQGSLRPININMGEGKVVGKAKYPISSSVSTTNICDVLFNVANSIFGGFGEPYGLAEGECGMAPNFGVISGRDWRKDGAEYINQIVLTGGGGPGHYGHDGWYTWGLSDECGVMYSDSVEIDELKFPILFHQDKLIRDTEGAGKWRGAPGHIVEYGPRKDPMKVAYYVNGHVFPPQGILGGEGGAPEEVYKITEQGERVDLDLIRTNVELKPGETIIGTDAGGGGYGDPLERGPEMVRKDIEDELVSRERARKVYRVVVERTEDKIKVDEEKTKKLRKQFREERS